MLSNQRIAKFRLSPTSGLLVLVLGLSGCSGNDGTAGDTGPTGEPGGDGMPGADGLPGADGTPGADGMPGADGNPGAGGADGEPGAAYDLQLSVPMSGQLEAPAAIATENQGLAKIAIDTQTGAVAGKVRLSFVATHVHVHGHAFAGDTAAVLFGLAQDATDPLLWTIPADTVLSAEDLAFALQGALYVNAHSAAHSSGEVRGQLLPPELELFRVQLDSDHEVPPPVAGVDDIAAAHALGYVTLNLNSGTVHTNVRTAGFVASKAHLHGAPDALSTPGIAGRTTAVLLEMSLKADSTPEDDFWASSDDAKPLSPAQINRLLAGELYLNTHTDSNKTGLVRGQVLSPDVKVYRVSLDGDQEFPKPTINTSTGLGYLTVDVKSGRLRGDVSALGFTPSKGHLHQGKLGLSGPVLIEFTANASDAKRFSAPEVGLNGSLNAFLDSAGLAALARGELYLNLHTAANPTGEARGQVLPEGWQLLRVPMDSAQEIPAPVAAAASTGLTLLAVDPTTGHAQGFGRVNGFTATAFHIHAGVAGQTGGVVIELGASPTETGKFDLPDGVFLDPTALATGGFYVNSHSATNTKGEVRGQLILK